MTIPADYGAVTESDVSTFDAGLYRQPSATTLVTVNVYVPPPFFAGDSSITWPSAPVPGR